MSENASLDSHDVVLGFDAAWGFAPADQTSPALAGAAGALIDTTMTRERVTELRVHGVSGSDGPTMLEHPQAVQVAGDTVTGFYRRWSPDGPGQPSVPWKLEAYSWGGLTEAPLASASWLLLAPFMMYNVAYFMLPPTVASADRAVKDQPFPHLSRDRGQGIAQVLLRLLALAATVQFVSSAASVLLSTVAWQAAGNPGLLLPSWMGWYGGWTAGWRVALALAAVAVVVALLWLVSARTASKYEARVSAARPSLNAAWPLTQPGFWRGKRLVDRQRRLHTAAACASLALIAALPAGHPPAARWVAVALSAAVLAAAAISVALPLADRHEITLVHGGRPPGGRADGWCWGVLAAALAALVTAALAGGFADRRSGRQTGALPGLTGFLAVLLALQAALLVVLAVSVVVLARRARVASRSPAASPGPAADVPPYLGGNLAALVALLGLVLGGLLTAVINIGVTRLLGAPVPSGFRFDIPAPDALAVPWPIYAFAAAPVGLLLGAVAAALPLWFRYRDRCNQFGQRAGKARSDVAVAYTGLTAGTPSRNGDDREYGGNRGAIAKAWAIGLVADDAGLAAALAVGGSLALTLAAELFAAVDAGPAGHPALLAGWLRGLASLVSLVGILVAGWLVGLLRQAYSDPAKRKSIGAVWDVGTFWPRAVHPLAPPCYAERAVPEVVDRIRLLTGHITTKPDDVAYLDALAGQPDLEHTRRLTVPPGPLLLTGYSQGAVIAPAVIAQLPEGVLPDVALLTLACPARRLYGRAFPAYLGPPQLTELARLLDAKAPGESLAAGQPAGRWKNLRRRSDYIGSWVFAEPPARLTDADLYGNIDQPCWDPVILVPDANPTPPPIHRHSQWWQDPRTNKVGDHLVRLLGGRRLIDRL
jgi:hypothetical protein